MSGSHSGAENSGGDPGSAWVFGGFWVLLFITTFLVAGPWEGFHAVLLGSAGLLMLLRPPVVALPRVWWVLAALFVIAGAGAFLPAGWFHTPEWRRTLEAVGVNTGTLVAIQSRQAVEALALFGITLLIGLWLAGHRPSSAQLRVWALAFTIGVAVYAIVSKVIQNPAGGGDQRFGFFPNRNHTATYLAMGTLCGLGNILQALRDRRFVSMAVALVATLVCLWAVAGWSTSRGGVVLVAIGCLIWALMLGKRYLGGHGLKAMALIGLAGTGLFFIADSGVKERFSKTVEKAGSVMIAEPPPDGGKADAELPRDLDFRIPTALDTFDLIRDFKLTGIGAGQFRYVFPQYRKLTVVANDSDNLHPESDWLWLAAETGIPATLALVTLIALAFRKSLGSILCGRDRALRSACLVAAMLVPIHGIFDVPGHRISLALGAAFLFALSMRAPDAKTGPQTPRALPFRLAAIAVLLVAGFLVRAQWGGGAPPVIVAGQSATTKVTKLQSEDQALQRAAKEAGQTHSPPPSEDLLERALTELDRAARVAPLQRNLYRLQGVLALHFDDKVQLAARAFAIDRALDPSWVGAPFQQAKVWSSSSPDEACSLWIEALERAKRLDRLQPDTRWSEQNTRQLILAEVQGKPALEAQWKDRSARKIPE